MGTWKGKLKWKVNRGEEGLGLVFGWLDGVKRFLAVRVVGLQDAKQLARESSVWRELVRV